MIDVYTAVEDVLSQAVVNKLVSETKGHVNISVPMGGYGYGWLKKRLPEFVNLAKNIPVIMLTDLDQWECAPGLISAWLGNNENPDSLLFRVAVREVEAWLLADREGFAEFARIPHGNMPRSTETLDDPKQSLLNLVKRHSPSRLKRDLLVDRGGGPKQGFLYNDILSDFVRNGWDAENAANNSDSLQRMRSRIRELAEVHAS